MTTRIPAAELDHWEKMIRCMVFADMEAGIPETQVAFSKAVAALREAYAEVDDLKGRVAFHAHRDTENGIKATNDIAALVDDVGRLMIALAAKDAEIERLRGVMRRVRNGVDGVYPEHRAAWLCELIDAALNPKDPTP